MGPKRNYVDKLFWLAAGFRPGLEGDFSLTGRLLSDDESMLKPLVSGVTNASHDIFGGWAVLTGLGFPATGCWEITGSYQGLELSFVISVEDDRPESSAIEGDEVDAYVRERRRQSKKSTPAAAASMIRVYSSGYVVGNREFGSLDELRDYVEPSPPGTFGVSLTECSARARADEVLELLGQLAQEYIRRLEASGHRDGFLYDQVGSSPRDCPWPK